MKHFLSDSVQVFHAPLRAARIAWEWYMRVEYADTVRRTINRGLLILVAGMLVCALTITLINTFFPSFLFDFRIAALLVLPSLVAAAWLARRGSTAGAWVLGIWLGTISTFVFEPRTYASPPIIHIIFLLPSLLVAIFGRPWQGLIAGVLESLGLCIALWAADLSSSIILNFLLVATLDITAVSLPVVVGAVILQRTIGEMDRLNVRLDREVSERTTELHQLMSLREKEITAVVHDINNRMLVVDVEIDDLIDEALRATTTRKDLHEARQRVAVALHRMRSLVEDLRTAVQLDNAVLLLQKAEEDLAALTQQVIDQHATHASISGCAIEQHLVDESLLLIDRRRMERVLANLISNAIKYTRMAPRERRHIAIRLHNEADGAILTISDTGPGLDAAALERLGQPFTRLASSRGTEGIGIGVYISKGIVELHGGQLSFSSPGLDQGTSVYLWLPRR